MQLEVFLQQEESSKKNCSLWHWQICPSYMWAGCSGWIRRPYMCQSVCDQDTKSQVAPRGREAPWWQLLTRHTVYVHLFYLIFKNIFWHVSAGCLLTTPLWHISYDNADSSFFTQPLTNEYVWSKAALRFGPSCFLLDFVRDEVLT